MRRAFAAKGLSNNFHELARPLLNPAIDLDWAQRVVFGQGAFVRAHLPRHPRPSSAIPDSSSHTG